MYYISDFCLWATEEETISTTAAVAVQEVGACTCICPAHLPRGGVICESVGQTDPVRHHHPAVLTVHRRALDLRSLSVPVRPVESAAGREERKRDDDRLGIPSR